MFNKKSTLLTTLLFIAIPSLAQAGSPSFDLTNGIDDDFHPVKPYVSIKVIDDQFHIFDSENFIDGDNITPDKIYDPMITYYENTEEGTRMVKVHCHFLLKNKSRHDILDIKNNSYGITFKSDTCSTKERNFNNGIKVYNNNFEEIKDFYLVLSKSKDIFFDNGDVFYNEMKTFSRKDLNKTDYDEDITNDSELLELGYVYRDPKEPIICSTYTSFNDLNQSGFYADKYICEKSY
ncbi:hypothetical protein SKA34_07888 [Photobacterium sp. SKA34]|uniref:hypothetical protein n=1 Tax=Photobacterium sp. SKA34 TaxID=121723 RepID=UPI00006B410E|nr:hypothetical protein [Photobacterium sp. SKA34]EAR57490.1 hypothetical protein SKA34_07888 [Photobacterium sp. SKA34]